jgi:hypothetical protein
MKRRALNLVFISMFHHPSSIVQPLCVFRSCLMLAQTRSPVKCVSGSEGQCDSGTLSPLRGQVEFGAPARPPAPTFSGPVLLHSAVLQRRQQRLHGAWSWAQRRPLTTARLARARASALPPHVSVRVCCPPVLAPLSPPSRCVPILWPPRALWLTAAAQSRAEQSSRARIKHTAVLVHSSRRAGSLLSCALDWAR